MQSFLLLSILFGITYGQIDQPQLFLNLEKDVQIDLYTLKNPIEPQIIDKDNLTSIHQTNYNSKIPTRVFIHGWLSNGELKNALTDAYFIKGKFNFNLIGINWERASRTLNYVAVSRYVEQVGIHIAEFLDLMIENKLLKLSNLRLIGFSLGAHVAGIIGKQMSSGKIPKITGLDPAKPLFDVKKPRERLDMNDATYVEIFHTNGGKLGFYDPIGQVNFYPNGGRSQPNCSYDISGLCSHQSSYLYFAETVHSPKKFYGHQCDSLDHVKYANCTTKVKAIFGGEPGASKQPNGIYYLAITSESQQFQTNDSYT